MSELFSLSIVGKAISASVSVAGKIKLFSQGGPWGRAVTDTANMLADAEEPRHKEIANALSEWCSTTEFGEFAKRINAGQFEFTIENCITSMKTASILLDKPEEVLLVFVDNLQVHLSAADPTFAERLHLQRHKEINTSFQFMLDKVGSLTEVVTAVASEGTEHATNIAEAEIRGHLNAAKALLDAEKVKAAKLLLESLRNEEQHYSIEARFRISNLLGVCALRVDDLDTAAVEFEVARILKPRDPSALANKASVLLLQGSFEEALKHSTRAVTESPDGASFNATHLLILGALRREQEIEAMVSSHPDFLENPYFLLALGQNYLFTSKYIEATECFEKGSNISPSNAHLRFLLAKSILEPVQISLISDPPLEQQQIEETHVNSLNRVIHEMSEAIKIIDAQDYLLNKVPALVNRAGVKTMLGLSSSAMDDLTEALRLEETNPQALINIGLLLMLSNELEEAEKFLKKVDFENSIAAAKVLVEVFFRTKRYPEALACAEKVWDANDADPFSLQIAERMAEIQYILNGEKSANSSCEKIVARYGVTPETLRLKGKILRRHGRYDEAIEHLIEAEREAGSNLKLWSRLELARTYSEYGRDLSANSVYKELCDAYDIEWLWVEYIGHLHNSYQYFSAYYRSKELRLRSDRVIPGVTANVEVGYLFESGDYNSAKELLLEVLQNQERSFSVMVNLIGAYLHLREFMEADKLLKSIDKTSFSKHEKDYLDRLRQRVDLNLSKHIR